METLDGWRKSNRSGNTNVCVEVKVTEGDHGT